VFISNRIPPQSPITPSAWSTHDTQGTTSNHGLCQSCSIVPQPAAHLQDGDVTTSTLLINHKSTTILREHARSKYTASHRLLFVAKFVKCPVRTDCSLRVGFRQFGQNHQISVMLSYLMMLCLMSVANECGGAIIEVISIEHSMALNLIYWAAWLQLRWVTLDIMHCSRFRLATAYDCSHQLYYTYHHET
jgi:hypothetical protein